MSTASDFVANLQKLSFFCLETKKEPKKIQGCVFPATPVFSPAKGQKLASLKQSALLTLRYGCSLNGEKSRSENLSACKPMQNQKYINDKSRNPVIH